MIIEATMRCYFYDHWKSENEDVSVPIRVEIRHFWWSLLMCSLYKILLLPSKVKPAFTPIYQFLKRGLQRFLRSKLSSLFIFFILLEFFSRGSMKSSLWHLMQYDLHINASYSCAIWIQIWSLERCKPLQG